jgi:hypothetical protein
MFDAQAFLFRALKMGSKVGPRAHLFAPRGHVLFFDQRIGLAASCPDITSWPFDNTQLILATEFVCKHSRADTAYVPLQYNS